MAATYEFVPPDRVRLLEDGEVVHLRVGSELFMAVPDADGPTRFAALDAPEGDWPVALLRALSAGSVEVAGDGEYDVRLADGAFAGRASVHGTPLCLQRSPTSAEASPSPETPPRSR